MTGEKPGSFGDNYDRALGQLDGLPDVVHTKATTINVLTPLVGAAQTFIVQTFRQRDQGDTVFLIAVSAEGSLRLVIPPRVTEAIARQRDALSAKSRSKAATALAADRKARGEVPGFLRPGAPRPSRGKRKPRRAKRTKR